MVKKAFNNLTVPCLNSAAGGRIFCDQLQGKLEKSIHKVVFNKKWQRENSNLIGSLFGRFNFWWSFYADDVCQSETIPIAKL